MKKSDLLARIVELERRVAQLEAERFARPIQPLPWTPAMPWPGTGWPGVEPVVITCGSAVRMTPADLANCSQTY